MERPNVWVACPECNVTLHKLNGHIIRKSKNLGHSLWSEVLKTLKYNKKRWWLAGKCPECGERFWDPRKDMKVVSDQDLSDMLKRPAL